MLDGEQLAQLAQYQQGLHQGDVISVHALATLGAPEATRSESTEAAAEVAEFRVTSVERVLPSSLWAIVTQTCDIRRRAEDEPFVQIAPLIESDETTWNEVWRGRGSVRRYAYPRIFDALEYPVLDIRIIQTLEKEALVAEGVDPHPIQFDPNERRYLSGWLGRRFARHAFQQEIDDEVLGPLRESAKKRLGKNSLAGAALDCREGLYAAYDQQGSVNVLLLLNQAKTLAHHRFQDPAKREKALKEGLEEIIRPVAKALEKEGSSIALIAEDPAFPTGVNAAAFMYRFHRVDLD